MTNVKLHINISQGIIDAEGDQDFVWRVYEDFRDRLSAVSPQSAPDSFEGNEAFDDSDGAPETGAFISKQKRRSPKKRASSGQAAASGKERQTGITGHRPRILSSLDTSGVKEFLAQFKLTSHTDRIVAMTRFLEGKGMVPATLDAYYTCYNDAALKTPEAFGQAFVDARTRGFIEVTSPDDVALTIRGKNHLDHGGIKKAEP